VETVDATCDTHGVYASRVLVIGLGDKPIMSSCPACSAERRDEERAKQAKYDAIDRQMKITGLLRAAGIPARFAGRTFGNYAATEQGQKFALNVCRAFVEAWPDRLKDGASLVLTGGPGTGKTHLACAVANAVMEKHLAAVAFGTVATMLRQIKDTYRKDSTRSEQDAINDLVRPDLLVLDEVGVQVGSEHEKLLMFEVLNARYQECRPTILISNLSADELETFLGQRVMDRYRECGAVIGFNWQSHRGRPIRDGKALAAGGDQ
jgi:DNA replication protein DnaC